MRPHRRQPNRLPHPWDSPGKNTGVGCHLLLQCMKVKSESEVSKLCLTLSHPMDCSLPGSPIHGIFQARVLAWAAISFSTRLSYLLLITHDLPPLSACALPSDWNFLPHVYPWRAPAQLLLFNSINLFTMRSSLTTENNLAKNLLCFSIPSSYLRVLVLI